MTSRYQSRYSTLTTRQCSTPGCTRSVHNVSGRCYVCTNNHRRFGAVDQTFPETCTLDAAIRRMEEARGRLKNLDLSAIEARWVALVDDCRGRSSPSFKTHKHLTYSKWDVEASALIRDLGEALTVTRALDLMSAFFLLRERDLFRDEAAFSCCLVEAFRRAANVGRMGGRPKASGNGAIENTYRKELSRQTRLAAARYLMIGLGAAAVALARRESMRAEQEQVTKARYHDAIAAIRAT